MEGGAGWISPGSTWVWAETGTMELTTRRPVARALNTPLHKLQRFSTIRCIRIYLSSFSILYDLRFQRPGPNLFPDRPVLKRIPAIRVSFSVDELSASFTSLPALANKKRLPAIRETTPQGLPSRDCRRTWPDRHQE